MVLFKARLVATASALALGTFAAPAWAQDSDTGASDAAAAAAPAEGEIIVTARKREERLQDTPIAITAVSGAALEASGATDLTDVSDLAPNVQIRSGGSVSGAASAPAIAIRGIGQSDFTINTEPGVGTYIDGIYLGRSFGSILDLVDVERIEVLRGPQGTLFGRNTIGGAISVVSKAPDPGAYSSSVTAMVGERELYSLKGSINVPLGEQAALRVSGTLRHRDGYVDALQYDDLKLGGEKVWGVRAALRLEATPAITFDLSADFTRHRDTPAAVVALDLGSVSLTDPGPTGSISQRFNGTVAVPAGLLPYVSTTRAQCASDPVFRDSSPTCYGNYYLAGLTGNNSVWVDNAGNKITPVVRLDSWGVHFTGAFDLGFADLKSITAYRRFTSRFVNDLDFTPFVMFHNNHDTFEQEQISQELQLVGDAANGRLNYVLGAYYFREDGTESLTLTNPLQVANNLVASLAPGFPFYQTTNRVISNNSLAFFAQATFDITPTLALTGGARWTRDEKNYAVNQSRITGTSPYSNGVQLSKEWTPMVNLSWKITPDVMTYATYSRGYRQGGFAARFSGGLPDPLPSYDPEFVNSYEVGLKTSWLNNRVTANFAAFQTDYSDIQVNATTPTLNGFTLNLANARLRGFEAELNARLLGGLGLHANVGYVHDEILKVAPNTATYEGTNIQTSITTANHLPGPDWQIGLGASYAAQLASGTLTPRVDWFHESSDYFDIASLPQTRRGPISTLDASIAYTPLSERFTATVGARNVLDKRNFNSINISSASGNLYAVEARPREIFAQLTVRFGEGSR